MVEAPARASSHRWFGAESDAQAGGGQHRQVIGTIADGDGPSQGNAVLCGKRQQSRPLAFPGDDWTRHFAGEAVADDLQPIGDDAVEPEFSRDPIGEDREPAGNERRCRAISAHRPGQDARAWRQADMRRRLLEDGRVDPRQQGDAGLERGDKVDLPVHRPAGDFRNVCADTEDHAELVEHFIFDDRRFEIGDQQPLAPPGRRLDNYIDRGIGDDLARGLGDRRRIGCIENEIARLAGRKPNGIGLDCQRAGDLGGEARNSGISGAGDQGQDDAHVSPSYAEKHARYNRLAGDRLAPPPAVFIGGPTASGKSALAFELAKIFCGTIINADSLQCYRDLKILTARPAAECARVPHRLYGYLDAAERGSVGSWRELALAEMAAVTAAGRLPIVVGGTGLYLRALALGLAPFPEIPEAVRKKALALHRALGGAAFHQQLASLDADSARRLHPGDTQRLVRAYEVVRATGTPIGAWRCRPHAPAPYRCATIVLLPPREQLYAACDTRFAAMIEQGALAEAAALAARALDPDLPAMKAMGLPELIRHLRGEIPLAASIAAAQLVTRHYAKRQMTWFRHQITADLILVAQFSESLLHRSRQFIDEFLLTDRE